MARVKCMNCGGQFKVKDELDGKTVKCPSCGAGIQVGGKTAETASEDALRVELLRLAGKAAPSASKSEAKPKTEADPPKTQAPKKRPPAAERRDPSTETRRAVSAASPVPKMKAAQRDYKLLIGAVAVVMVLALAGFALFLRYQSHKGDREIQQQKSAETIQAALAESRQATSPCQEAAAAQKWEQVKSLAQAYEQEYGDGGFLSAITEAGDNMQKLKAAVDERRDASQKARKLLVDARRQVASSDFVGAKKGLDTAAALLKSLKCPEDEDRKAQDEVAALLASEDIVYRSKGWVQDDKGKWMSARDMAEQKRQAKIAEMMAQGLVEYEGKWMTPAERDALVEQKRVALEKEQSDREQRRDMALWVRSEQVRVQQGLQNGDPEVVLDSCAERLRWLSEPWANPAELSIEEYGDQKKERYLTAKVSKGNTDKWVISISQPASIQDYDELKIDFDLSQSAQVALGVWTMPGYELFESTPPMQIAKGMQKDVSFNLKAKAFKSRATNWTPGGEILHRDGVFKLSLFIYTESGDPVRVKNVRLVKNAKKAAGGH